MTTYTRKVYLNTKKREECKDITSEVQRIVGESGVETGLCHVYSRHTTAGIMINEGHDPDVAEDLMNHLRQQVPQREDFKHAEGNSDAHIKMALVGSNQMLPLENGSLQLGTWQRIFFCEFDGPRDRRVSVMVMGE
jgi:secondary thiamine-phosphate synthase enzyme